jgi:L-2-hydroxyglutarate oxidase LhgO
MEAKNARVASKWDVTIIGAGVVGLSIGNALLESNPKLRVLIVEKESKLGLHASGRNSGVIHAGFYYSPESLKAKFCRDGNRELRKLCLRNSIPILETGKVVVTQNLEEETRLETLFERGIENGVELEMHHSAKLNSFEPQAVTLNRFLWSPTTAVSDPHAVIIAMSKEFEDKGGKIEYGKNATLTESGSEISIDDFDCVSRFYINASGAQSDRISRAVGVGLEYAMLPFMGVYRATSNNLFGLKTLVYPVPHPINPFLGVHFTLTTDGKVKIGPTAIPISGREQYSLGTGWSMSDIYQALKGAKSLILGDSHDVLKILKSEWPKMLEKEIVKQASELVPNALQLANWQKKPPGIRSQLVHLPTGKLEQDFKVISKANSLHVLNAVSPGWTSSIPFGRYIADLVQREF